MKEISRRQFLKSAGAGALMAGTAAAGCKPRDAAAPVTTGAVYDGEEQMVMRTNHNTGDRVSLLGYGCMRWPMITDGQGREIIDQKAVNELVDKAMEGGVNYYDTSPVYLQGLSERAAGEALRRYPRDSYFIATKLSNFSVSSQGGSLQMYNNSFEQLYTKYFDYYLLHSIGGGAWEKFEKRYISNGMLDFLKKEKQAGRIRNLGFSFHGTKDNFDRILQMHDRGEVHWDFAQIQLNYIDWTHAQAPRNVNADYLYEQLSTREIPIVIMEPLQGGRLATLPLNVAERLKAREPDRSLASWAFRFAGTHPGVLTVLSGMASMEPLVENLDTYRRFVPLTGEEMEFLEEMATLIKEYPLVNCNYCNYCMPCPYGIDIPGNFRHYNDMVTEGTFAQSSLQEDYRRLRRAYLASYDRAVDSRRQADHCIGCRECMPHCPQSISIPKEMRRIASYVEQLKQDTL